MREILPGIFSWGVLSERHGYDFNGTYVRDPAGNLCIDPVEPDEETLIAGGSSTAPPGTDHSGDAERTWVRFTESSEPIS